MKKFMAILLACLMVFTSLPNTVLAAQSPDFEQDLTQYLSEISTARGYEVTREDVEETLAYYEFSMEDFETVQELKEFLGEVISADLSNLNSIYENYDLTQDTLTKLLADNGETIDDYIFLDDLDEAAYFYSDSSEFTDENLDMAAIMEEVLPQLLASLDITDAEIAQLTNHFTSIEEYMNSPEVAAKLTELDNRMMDLVTAMISGEKTDEEVASEMASIYEEVLPILKLNAKITIVQNGTEKEVTLTELFLMGELASDATLKVALYNLDSQLLVDFSVSEEMFASEFGTGEQIENVTQDVVKVVEKASTSQDKTANQTVNKTVKGAKLPKTATNHMFYTLMGFVLVFAGVFMYRKVRDVKGENIQENAA